ncbi:MAG TPA: HAMP domain-containing sensor histidine kinase [Terriglobales bacterium]|nr:HAMP domain-containing sensor histidine kinase [Terriglobales bacterium]
MVKLRMRTKFLLSMLLISAGLTCTSLLLVRRSVQGQVKKEIFADLHNSVSTFRNFQRERELTLIHSAELLADLPNLRALMTTQHEATIQDASNDLWRLAGSDLFVLADRTGRVVALHTASPGLTHEMAQESFGATLNQEGPEHWWFGAHHLYEVFLKPIYFGPATENRLLGFLVIGYEIDDKVASQVSRIAASQVAFFYGDSIVRSTLTPSQETELARQRVVRSAPDVAEPEEVQLGDERFLGASLELSARKTPSVRLSVLKSYDQATAFLDSLNRLLLALGLTAVVGGSALVFLISHTFTRPLGDLVAGVRALEKGDFTYSLDARGGDEVAEVTRAFNRMRDSLLNTQRELLEAERLATIGRMASSISHDLRHSLAAIVANAEFLCESRLSSEQREELYQEVRIAVNQMTDLIDSLLEFSRTRESLRPTYGSVKESVERVAQAIWARPEFHQVHIAVSQQGNSTGWFDPKKLERALYNLLLNSCEAVAANAGNIEVELREVADGVEVRVRDNGRGIPESIRGKLFEPFVSYGKENGTGLGLTVVQKIVQDHGGDVTVEKTSAEGTVFRLLLPLTSSSESTPENRGERRPEPPPLARTKRAQSE